MIHCPKCHFRQPKDQYCASCGIDILAFKPPPVSKSKKIFESGNFQIFILIVVAAIMAYFIAQTDRPQNWVRKFSYYQKVTSKTTTPAQKVESMSSTFKDDPDKIELSVSDQVNTNEFSSAENAVPNSQPSSDVKLIYAEVSREVLNSWIADSQRLGLYQSYVGDFSAGILPDFKSRTSNNFKDLKTEQKKLYLKKPEALLSGKTVEETSEFLGLQTNIDIKSKENNTTQGHINITKISRSGKVDLPIEFELQKNAVFFINWKSAMVGFENETTLFSTQPFQILKSQDFLNQKTEFIILIEPL